MFSIFQILNITFEILKIIIIVRIILSWIPHNRYHPIINFIYAISEPILKPFRNMINPIQGIDVSPIIVFIILSLLKNLIL